MPISAGLREDIAVYRGFIGQQYFILLDINVLNNSLMCAYLYNENLFIKSMHTKFRF